MTKLYVFLLFFQSFAFFANAQDNPTIIYLVRHAEKVTSDPNDKNPSLTEAGFKRAKILAKRLKNIELAAIYSTDFQRTKLTATPVSQKKTIPIQLYDPKKLEELSGQILQQNRGKNVLIVGHSNTVLETIEALGGTRPVAQINDADYNYLFELTIMGPNISTKIIKFM